MEKQQQFLILGISHFIKCALKGQEGFKVESLQTTDLGKEKNVSKQMKASNKYIMAHQSA